MRRHGLIRMAALAASLAVAGCPKRQVVVEGGGSGDGDGVGEGADDLAGGDTYGYAIEGRVGEGELKIMSNGDGRHGRSGGDALGAAVLLPVAHGGWKGLLGHALGEGSFVPDPAVLFAVGEPELGELDQRASGLREASARGRVAVDAEADGEAVNAEGVTHVFYEVSLTGDVSIPEPRYQPASRCCAGGAIAPACAGGYVARVLRGSGEYRYLRRLEASAPAAGTVEIYGGERFARVDRVAFADAYFAFFRAKGGSLCRLADEAEAEGPAAPAPVPAPVPAPITPSAAP